MYTLNQALGLDPKRLSRLTKVEVPMAFDISEIHQRPFLIQSKN